MGYSLNSKRKGLTLVTGEYFASTAGGAMHRSLHSLPVRRMDVILALLMTAFFSVLSTFLLPFVGMFWASVIDFGCDLFHFPGVASYYLYEVEDWVEFVVPYVAAPTPVTTTAIFWTVGFVTAGLAVASFIVSPLRVPLRYALRVIAGMQLSSLLFFYFFPHDFPYSISDYLAAIINMDLVFLVVIPWILGSTYFIFDFPLHKKLLFYFLVLVYFILESPVHFFFHALILRYTSMLIAPVLYALFGLSLQVFLFMALYAWAMSWE